MKEDDKKTIHSPEVEAFLAKNQERIAKFRRISEEAEEEMEEISLAKSLHPELSDPEYQVKLTNEFLANHPDVSSVTLDTKDD